MTKEEKHLWYDFLKTIPLTVHRQKVIGPYIVDFCTENPRFVIELDGSQHGEEKQMEKDAARDAFLTQNGYQVLRYSNYMIHTHFRDICEDIWGHLFPDDV